MTTTDAYDGWLMPSDEKSSIGPFRPGELQIKCKTKLIVRQIFFKIHAQCKIYKFIMTKWISCVIQKLK